MYFSSHDFTHLTDLGYAIVGQDAATAVVRLGTNGGHISKGNQTP